MSSMEQLNEIEAEYRDFSALLNAQYLVYALPEGAIQPFVGGGPLLGFSWGRDEQIDREVQRFTNGREEVVLEESVNRSQSYRVGLVGVLGFEWFVHSNISLSAEYGVRASYRWSQNEQSSLIRAVDDESSRREVTTEGSSSGLEVRARSVLFGVALYF